MGPDKDVLTGVNIYYIKWTPRFKHFQPKLRKSQRFNKLFYKYDTILLAGDCFLKSIDQN